jgi:hypothetical protein
MSPFNFTGTNDKPALAFDRACNQEKIRNERLNASLVESYVWEPFFCDLTPWDGVKFCELLGKHHCPRRQSLIYNMLSCTALRYNTQLMSREPNHPARRG